MAMTLRPQAPEALESVDAAITQKRLRGELAFSIPSRRGTRQWP